MSGTLVIAPAWLGLSGLWTLDAKGRRKAVDAEDLGLSEELADRLEAWMDAFDAIYDEEQEARSRFASEAEQRPGRPRGRRSPRAVAAELGPDWTVSPDLDGWQEMTRP